MRTTWIGVLLFLLSITTYSLIPAGLNGAGGPLSKTRAAPLIAAPPQSPDPRPGLIALDASPGRQAPGYTRNDNQLAANLSAYVFLHKTWNAGISTPTQNTFGVCSE